MGFLLKNDVWFLEDVFPRLFSRETEFCLLLNLHSYGPSRDKVKHRGTHLAHLHSSAKVDPCRFFNDLIGDRKTKAENEKSDKPGNAKSFFN